MKTKLYILLLALLSLASCNNWLDITPKGQTESKDLFTTEKGYNSALGGVYYILSEPRLYGKELTYGAMDLLAQYWDISDNVSHKYYEMSLYNYTDANARPRIDSVWSGLYQAIAQCNEILAALDGDRDNLKYPELIEGEALALRGFCHMELFRMFGPVIRTKADLDKSSIAYRTQFNVTAQLFESGSSVLGKAEADLKKALELMANDPINVNQRKGDGNVSLLDYHDVLNRRGDRMNYYAVLGMLARLEQLRLNNTQAYTYADRLIREVKGSETFMLADKANISTGVLADLTYSQEMLFALYQNKLYELADENFMMNGKGLGSTSFPISNNLFNTFRDEIYGRQPDGDGRDNRLNYWFTSVSGSARYTFNKYKQATDVQGLGRGYDSEVPILRLSEIYYIACEAQIGRDNTLALSYLNDVRESRNLPKLEGPLTDEVLRDYLIREARKDFIGEGRMFPMYKRMFEKIYVKPTLEIAPVEERFVFPIPEAEYEYSPNVKPAK